MPWARALTSTRAEPARAGGPGSGRLRDLVLGGLFVLVTGCAPRGPRMPVLEPGPAGVAALLEALGSTPTVPDLEADLQLLVHTRGQRPVRLQGALRVAWPDRVRLQARMGALFPVASLVVRADSSYLLLPRAKAYWSGTTDASGAGSVGGIADGILWLLCPGPRLASLEESVLDATRAGPRLRGRLRGEPDLWVTAQFARKELEVREILVQDEQGNIVLKGTRKGRQELEGAGLPRSVRIEIIRPPSVVEARILRPRRDAAAGAGTFRLARPAGSRWLEPEELLPLLGAPGGKP